MQGRCIVCLAALLGVWCVGLVGEAVRADTIHFNDGMRTICQGKAWEEKGEVHCEFDGGGLVYPATQVARIEKSTQHPGSSPAPVEAAAPAPPPAQPAPALRPPPPAAIQGPDQAGLARSSGVPFYNPRRLKKYWSSPSSHHDSYQDAIAALAAEFDRPVRWIEEQIGDTNDLEQIRAILASRRFSASEVSGDPEPPSSGGIVFYDPRRPKKYWTSADARHSSYAEALEALARDFGGETAWVEIHMGDSNDVDTIRYNLHKARSAEKKQQ